MIREFLKAIAKLLFSPYRVNRIYTFDLSGFNDFNFLPPGNATLGRITDPEEFNKSGDPEVLKRAWVAGSDAYGYGLWQNGKLACMCWFWTHRRFRDTLIWRIHDNEAIMMELLTTEQFRGMGFAPTLIRFAAAQLKGEGFNRLYTWVWHSNAPSVRAFEKAGWRRIAFVVEVHLFGWKRPARFEWRNKDVKL